MAAKRKAWNKGIRKQWCDSCDGCGWVEGGRRYLQTKCYECDGTGKVWPRRAKTR